ncbi:coiled-coil domain-containing protein 13-like [Tubulanus polymorphus]|uniref:coiled-coil domain-containing protein 13-like n=1 Tax=Tubulanus polymorphus TaxID=672921 RepID=UPI003DA604E6
MASQDENLKQQFQLLQEQQQKKLLRRKQKKEINEKEKRKNDSKKEKEVALSTAFNVDDDLGLKLAEPPLAEESYISEELVEHLNNGLREMKDENGRLYKLLNEREFEIKQLKKKREGDRAALAGGAGIGSDVAATKIVDLSKKVRELTSELESERTKSKQFQRKCIELQRDVKNLSEQAKQVDGTVPEKNVRSIIEDKSDEVEVKGLQDKLKSAETRMAEFRMQNQTLKLELQKAMKVLSQEVGDNVNVQSLLNNPGNWKGRAQQVLLLQKKVSELKGRLNEKKSQSQLDLDLEDEFMGSNASVSMAGTSRRPDDKNQEQLRKLQKERKEQQERAAAELKALEEDYKQLKSKMEGVKARHKVLANENKSLKQQMQTLLQKGQHDDQLIEALMKQQEQLRSMLDESTKLQQQLSVKTEEHLKEMSQKSMKEDNLVDQLKKVIAEKEERIQSLEEDFNELKLTTLYKTQANGVSTLFERSAQPSTVAENNVNDMTTESCSPPVTSRHQQTSRAASRIETDRPISNRSNRPNSATTNKFNLSGLEDLENQCQEFKSLQKAAEVERDKLTELVKLLQIRLDESTLKVTEAQSELQGQKRRNVLLEKQLGKAKIEQNKTASSRQRSSVGRGTARDETAETKAEISDANFEELETRLAIQQDENSALKAALKSTLKAKEEDLNLYHQTLEETRKVFIQGLRQFKHNNSS